MSVGQLGMNGTFVLYTVPFKVYTLVERNVHFKTLSVTTAARDMPRSKESFCTEIHLLSWCHTLLKYDL